jgi:hypothetical protein
LKKSRLYLGLELQKREGCFWNHRRDHFDASGVSACFDERRNCAQNFNSLADTATIGLSRRLPDFPRLATRPQSFHISPSLKVTSSLFF